MGRVGSRITAAATTGPVQRSAAGFINPGNSVVPGHCRKRCRIAAAACSPAPIASSDAQSAAAWRYPFDTVRPVQPGQGFSDQALGGRLILQAFRDQFASGENIGQGDMLALDQLQGSGQPVGGRGQPVVNDQRAAEEKRPLASRYPRQPRQHRRHAGRSGYDRRQSERRPCPRGLRQVRADDAPCSGSASRTTNSAAGRWRRSATAVAASSSACRSISPPRLPGNSAITSVSGARFKA